MESLIQNLFLYIPLCHLLSLFISLSRTVGILLLFPIISLSHSIASWSGIGILFPPLIAIRSRCQSLFEPCSPSSLFTLISIPSVSTLDSSILISMSTKIVGRGDKPTAMAPSKQLSPKANQASKLHKRSRSGSFSRMCHDYTTRLILTCRMLYMSFAKKEVR